MKPSPLRRRVDFDRVVRDAPPLRGERVILYVATSDRPPRVGFVAGRRVGGAVARNRARRLLREAWRAVAPRLGEAHDAVLVARPAIEGARAEDVRAEVESLLARAGLIRT